MTEPSKVIHVRNVGHEISEVCAWDDFHMLNISQWHTLIQLGSSSRSCSIFI